MTSFDVVTPRSWREFGSALRNATNGRTVQRAVTRTLRAETKPVTDDIKAAVLAMRIRGTGGGGTAARRRFDIARRPVARARSHRLRATIARAVKSSVRFTGTTAAMRIYIDTTVLPPDQRSLPGHLDSRTGWSHPRFGDRSRWYRQRGEPFFASTIRRHAPGLRRRVLDAVSAALKELQ